MQADKASGEWGRSNPDPGFETEPNLENHSLAATTYLKLSPHLQGRQIEMAKSDKANSNSESEVQEKEIDELLDRAEQQIKAQEMTEAFETLLRLEELEAETADEDVSSRIQALMAEAEKIERQLSGQRQEARDLIESAADNIDAGNYSDARDDLDRASELDTEDLGSELAGRLSRLEAELDAELEDLESKKQEARRLIAQAENKLDENDTLGAFKIIAKLRHTPQAAQTDDVGSQINELRRRAEQMEERLAARQDAEELIETARDELQNWNLGVSRQHLEEASALDICDTDEELRNRVEEAFGELEAAEAEMEEQRSEARDLLRQGRKHLKAGNFASADSTLEELENKDVLERDQELAEDVEALRKQTNSAREKLEQERQKASDLLEKARQHLSDWDLDAAQSKMTEAARLHICDVDDGLQEAVNQVRSEIENTRSTIEEERGEAISLLAEADWKVTRCDLSGASSCLEKLRELEALQRDSELQKRADKLEERIEEQQADLDAQREEVQQLLSDARNAARNWDFKKTSSLLEKAKDKRVSKFDSSLRSRIRSVQSEITNEHGERERQKKKARSLLASAWKMMAGGDFERALEKLTKAEDLQITEHDEKLGSRISEYREKAEEAWGDFAEKRDEAMELIEAAEEKQASGDIEGAEEKLNDLAALQVEQLDPQLHRRAQALREQIAPEEAEEKAPATSEETQAEAAEAEEETAEEEISEAEEEAEELLETIEAHLDSGDLDEAAEEMEELAAMIEDDMSEDLHERMDVMQELLESAVEEQKEAAEEAEEGAAEKDTIDVESMEELEAAMDRVIGGEEEDEEEELPEPPEAPQQPVRRAVKKQQPAKEDETAASTVDSEGEEGWYYFRDGHRVGPMSFGELENLAEDGDLNPQDKIWLPKSAQWTPARAIPELEDMV